MEIQRVFIKYLLLTQGEFMLSNAIIIASTHNVVLQLAAFLLGPRIGALINRNDKPR